MFETVLAAIQNAMTLVEDLFFDGFVALMVVALVGPVLGTLLVLRRMPLLGLAIPQAAGCGQAASFFLFATWVTVDPAQPEEPGPGMQLAASLAGVFIGLLLLALLGRDRRFSGVHAGVLFLAALGLKEIFYLESPYHQVFEEAIHHGRILTVVEAGRWQATWTGGVLFVVLLAFRRSLWTTAFDPDQSRLNGVSPALWSFATLMILGAFCGLCVPVVGAEVILTLLLVPAAIIRGATPSVALFGPLCAVAGVTGAYASFVVACAEEVNWPPAPALILCVIASSVVTAMTARIGRLFSSRAAFLMASSEVAASAGSSGNRDL